MIGAALLGLGLVVGTPAAPTGQQCAPNYLAVGTLIDAKAKADPKMDAATKAKLNSFARAFLVRGASMLGLSDFKAIPQPMIAAADALFKPVRAGDAVAHAKLMDMIGQCDAAFKLDAIVK
jgi:hypothetical protein